MERLERIDLVDEEDRGERKKRYWKLQYLGNQMSLSYVVATLKKMKDCAELANTLVATEMKKAEYDKRVASAMQTGGQGRWKDMRLRR